MAGRSLSATPHGLTIANNALTGLGISKEDFAAKVEIQGKTTTQGIGIATVKKFFTGKSVDRKYFVGICQTLGLNWEKVAGLKTAAVAETAPVPKSDINHLVQTVRAQVHADIQDRCGKMRVLDMEQPIGLGDIYTNVNILEKLSGSRRLGFEELLQDCDPENFDRFLLGQIRHERVPGLEAVERHSQLMILGKPGAGKTTFMKRMAILCNEGKFQPQRVPIFVTLKDYAEVLGKPKLQTYIQNQWISCGIQAADALSTILGNGKALVLLDGLDEVYETDHDRVLQNIKTFAHQFRDCQCVITCRIAAWEYTFEQFTEVEVADFDQKQIVEFATKWFQAKNDPKKAEIFIQRLKDTKPIQELATNPLLLTLLCLVFGEAVDFPANRAELYKEGLDVLLRKWDGKRNIERDKVYKKLSLKRKEDLLSQLAFKTFEQGIYFFKQSTVESHIIQYIRNLSGASDDEEALHLDSEAVLKSIEAQHGLLVERARGIYSFSHLTFQEYFTARQIVGSTTTPDFSLQHLATHFTEKRYREIFFLTLNLLPQADFLIFSIKKHIDQLISRDENIQSFLSWSFEKSEVVRGIYKASSVRALYFAFEYDNCIEKIGVKRHLPSIIDPNILSALVFDLEIARDVDFYYLIKDMSEYSGGIRLTNIVFTLNRIFEKTEDSDFELSREIREMKNLMPSPGEFIDFHCSKDSFQFQMGLENLLSCIGIPSVQNVKAIMIRHRNIGHNWHFSNTQKEKMQQYYDANQFLVDCLNSDCYVTKATRQYIEDTLLLPLSEIEKYPVPNAIAHL